MGGAMSECDLFGLAAPLQGVVPTLTYTNLRACCMRYMAIQLELGRQGRQSALVARTAPIVRSSYRHRKARCNSRTTVCAASEAESLQPNRDDTVDYTHLALQDSQRLTAAQLLVLHKSAKVLSNTAFITGCATVVAAHVVLMLLVVLGTVPSHAQLAFQAASQLASGAWICCWAMYTVLGWRMMRVDAFRVGCIVLLCMLLPLAYCCIADPSNAGWGMGIGFITFLCKPTIANDRAACAATSSIATGAAAAKQQGGGETAPEKGVQPGEQTRLMQNAYSNLTGWAGTADRAVFFGLFFGFIVALQPHTVFMDAAGQCLCLLASVLWVCLLAVHTVTAGLFDMAGAFYAGSVTTLVVMLPLAFYGANCVLTSPLWFQSSLLMLLIAWLPCSFVSHSIRQGIHSRMGNNGKGP